MAVAAVLNLTNDTLLVMPVTVVAAILLLRTGQNTKIHGDAAIAMLSVGSLAVWLPFAESVFDINEY